MVALAVVTLAVLPFVGRWERSRHARTENARMEAIYGAATSDGLNSKRLIRYRLDSSFDCFVYYPKGHPDELSAYELCFDPEGRLVETVNRRAGVPKFGSLLEEPSLAAVRVPVHELIAVLVERKAPPADARLAGLTMASTRLPLAEDDIGLFPFPVLRHKQD